MFYEHKLKGITTYPFTVLLSTIARCTKYTVFSLPEGGGGEREGVFFLRPPHVRDFVKEGFFLYPGTKYGGQNPLTIHEIYAALTPSDSRSDWASEFAATTRCR